MVHDSGAVELGALCGPAKVSLIGAWFTGDDYRGGTLYGNNRMFKVTSGLQSDTWSNTSVFRPYSYLMVYGYGLGTSFARDTGNGFVQDATFYGARFDYAAAANLNLFSSFAWAERFSNSGFLWGYLRLVSGYANDCEQQQPRKSQPITLEARFFLLKTVILELPTGHLQFLMVL